jgi:cephalosporin hydroxylase
MNTIERKEEARLNKNALEPGAAFKLERAESISRYPSDKTWQTMSGQWLRRAFEQKYMYNFEWMGRPIIQTPIDMVAMQEITWQVKPDLIIETGIAHGGSLILSASMLAMIDYCEATEAGKTLDPAAGRRRVLGLDIDIRAHNRAAIEAHPLAHKIDMIQGSSIAPEITARVHEYAKGYERILLCLDSNHTHEHVLAELEAYAPLVSPGSYCVVFDTIIEDLPDDMFPDRLWGKGNNPKTAVWEYLCRLKEEYRTAADGARLRFEIDKIIENKLLTTVAPDGYLHRVM